MAADEALHPEQFRMRTNIKAAPNSQGTLFQGGYPTRYPRGYTPERMHEVINATVHSGLDPSATHPRRARETAVVRDTLARSTVPVEHLQGVGWYPHSDVSESREIGGHYSNRVGRSQIHVAPTYGSGLTPIHEIGHHVSATVEKTEHSVYDTPERRGTEEGYAENYAETHFRDRRGKQQRSERSAAGWASRESTPEKSHALARTFGQKRNESPLASAAPTMAEINAMSPRQRGLPPQHVEGQMPLLDKTGSGGYVERYEGGVRHKPGEPRHWDYTDEQRQRGLKRERD